MAKHTNNGDCPKCEELFNKYPNFNETLKSWFKNLQKTNPEAHISCAGRGKKEQEEAFNNKASKAHFGQSSHNFNAAIDIFVISKGIDLYDKMWFNNTIAPAITPNLEWYGKPGSKFFELPHVELKEWKSLVQSGALKIVE